MSRYSLDWSFHKDRKAELGVVVINYKSAEQTVEYIKNELSKISIEKRIVIVNNACTDSSNLLLASSCHGRLVHDAESIQDDDHIFVLGAEENLGYARGNNLGAKFLIRHFGVRYILFSNNDLELNSADVIDQLVATLEAYPDAGAAGPKIVDPRGRDQSPLQYANVWRRIIIYIGLWPFVYPLIRRGCFSDLLENAPFGHYFRIMGCFFLVDALAFAEADGFDENTFLYAEEAILSERLNRLGRKMYYNPEAMITHQHGQVISRHMHGMQSMRLRLESELYFYKRYKKINAVETLLSHCSLLLFSRVYIPAGQALKFAASACSQAYRKNAHGQVRT